MSVEIKQFLDVSEFSSENVPMYGDMPDVSMAFPWSSDIFPDKKHINGNPDCPNGAVWPWRLFFGAEDDPNRSKVYEWIQVDDFDGLNEEKLWAGVYNGTIFLHAGKNAPAVANDDFSDVTGAPIGDTSAVWRNGQPNLPFSPIGQELRDQVLKNETGQWRRLTWEPIALFDIATSKKIFSESGERNIVRYTLWCIVECPWVVFFTTSASIDSQYFQNGQPARWPFSYYGRLTHVGDSEIYKENEKDGGFVTGWYNPDDHFENGYRLAPLPWQKENGGILEPESDFEPYDGAHEGHFYALPPAWPCPRYLATANDYRINGALIRAYREDDSHYQYVRTTKEQAKKAIINSIKDAASKKYSIDPAFIEELNRVFPEGVEEGTCWQNDPPQFSTVFSLHLEEKTDRWPHWLALMSCNAPTALLTASACSWYNDFPQTGDNYTPKDEDDYPPKDEEDYIFDDPNGTPENDNDGGGGNGEKGYKYLEPAYYYEAGNGVEIKRTWNGLVAGKVNRPPGWNFFIHVDPIATTGFAFYNISLSVKTENDEKTYMYDGQECIMFYNFIQGELSSDIVIDWKSSANYADDDKKTTTASATTTSDFSAVLEFDDISVSSEDSPDFCGNALSALKIRSFDKKGTFKTWDKFSQRWTTVRFARRFDVYKISVRGDLKEKAQKIAQDRAPFRQGSFSPASIRGVSEGLDGPLVTALKVSGTGTKNAINQYFDTLSATVSVEYETCSIQCNVSGSDEWYEDGQKEKRKGYFKEEDRQFTATLPSYSAFIIL